MRYAILFYFIIKILIRQYRVELLAVDCEFPNDVLG